MSSKAVEKEHSVDQLKEELQKIKSSTHKDSSRLREIAKSLASNKQWDLANEALQQVENKTDRNLLIADLIEEHLLPAKEVDRAKKFANYLVEDHEMKPLLLVRIALCENDHSQALKLAKTLGSPLSRNFAFLHIIESYLMSGNKEKAKEACNLILENTRTIYDAKVRSSILRDIAIDLYFANHENGLAKQAAELIPDATIKAKVLSKIGAAK